MRATVCACWLQAKRCVISAMMWCKRMRSLCCILHVWNCRGMCNMLLFR
jgi:hypothetical protein